MTKLIVFDWNGTLLADTAASWKAANVCLEFYGKSPITIERYREIFHFPIMLFYERCGCTEEEVMAHKDEVNPIFQSTYEGYAKNARTRSGTRDVLDWIRANDLHCMILSNYRTEKINEHLRRLKIERFFDYVCAHNCDGTTILKSKTKSGRLTAYMDQHGYKPENTIIIGDSMEEPEIAGELGLTSVGITGGYISDKRLHEAQPDHIIHNLSDLKTVLAKKWSLPC